MRISPCCHSLQVLRQPESTAQRAVLRNLDRYRKGEHPHSSILSIPLAKSCNLQSLGQEMLCRFGKSLSNISISPSMSVWWQRDVDSNQGPFAYVKPITEYFLLTDSTKA